MTLRVLRWALSLAALAAAPAVGFAAGLDIASTYGNATGCRVLAGGDYTGDDRFLLHPDRYEAHESVCEYLDVVSSREGAQVVRALCQGEGSYWIQSLIVSPPDPENETLLVFFDSGELWHEVSPCSP